MDCPLFEGTELRGNPWTGTAPSGLLRGWCLGPGWGQEWEGLRDERRDAPRTYTELNGLAPGTPLLDSRVRGPYFHSMLGSGFRTWEVVVIF